MEWIIESYDRRTDRDGQNCFTSESAFISAAEELLRNTWKGFVSATLPDGRVLDEAAMRAVVARAAVNRWGHRGVHYGHMLAGRRGRHLRVIGRGRGVLASGFIDDRTRPTFSNGL